MPHTRLWDETIPIGTDGAGYGDVQMRNKWVDIQERMKINHIWDESQTYDGEHLDDKIVDYGNVSGSVSLNFANGRIFKFTLNGNTTITSVTNHGASADYARNGIILAKQNASNLYTLTFPTSFKTHNGQTLGMTQTNSATSVFTITTFDGGTTWVLTWVGDFVI